MKIYLKQKILNLISHHQTAYILIDRLVVKDFDEDDMHRISDSVNTAFYEGEGEVILEVNGDTDFAVFQ